MPLFERYVGEMIAKTLPGLPPYGDAAKNFPEPNAFREGLVVSFTPTNGDRWVGNFKCGPNSLHGIHEELGEEAILVVAGGDAYLVNATEQRASLEAPWVRSVNFEPDLDIFIIADDCGVTAIGKSGVKWRSRRVSWDGITQLEKKGMSLHGLAYNIHDLPPVPFIIDLETGHASGGSYGQMEIPTKLGSLNWLRPLKRFLGDFSQGLCSCRPQRCPPWTITKPVTTKSSTLGSTTQNAAVP